MGLDKGKTGEGSPVDRNEGNRNKFKLKIQSELLCYISHKMDIMPESLLVKLVSEFYNDDEIWKAKEMVYKDLAPDGRLLNAKVLTKNSKMYLIY